MDSAFPVIVGPTASGKTQLGLEFAGKYNGEIISIDSRQVYLQLTVGTAKPVGLWKKSIYWVGDIPYHLVDFLNPTDSFSAAQFVHLAENAIGDIRARGKIPIFVGGTGFYFKALRDGLAPMPPADAAVREELRLLAEKEGRPYLHALLARTDPEAAQKIPFNNIHRVIRALEVYRLTGKPLTQWHAEHQSALKRKVPTHRFKLIGLDPGIQELTRRIEHRCAMMLKQGMIEETSAALKAGVPENSPGLSGLGYPRIVSYLKGTFSKAELLRYLIQDTRQYAKRQRTWFKTQLEVEWNTDVTPA